MRVGVEVGVVGIGAARAALGDVVAHAERVPAAGGAKRDAPPARTGRGSTPAAAESLTGGAMSAALAAAPSASSWFRGGVTALLATQLRSTE
ncbi:CinA family protein [Terrabacter lapilli]|uniref:CinA family protein n=1 Tax=Terrabacter lapilli TaxID=436231 RepID=UPI0031D46EFF